MPENENPQIRRELPAITDRPAVDRSFVELCALTNFLFLRGASHPDEMPWRAAQLGYGAIGITDINTLASIRQTAGSIEDVHRRSLDFAPYRPLCNRSRG